jgi:hypothetical protein
VLQTFLDKDTRTTCDVSPSTLPDGSTAYEVNRINTPRDLRGQGYASRMMRDQVLPTADQEQLVLFLSIQPTGGLDYVDLATWYHRLGFRPKKYGDVVLWVRYPFSDGATQ